jgi:hypothetical protein
MFPDILLGLQLEWIRGKGGRRRNPDPVEDRLEEGIHPRFLIEALAGAAPPFFPVGN